MYNDLPSIDLIHERHDGETIIVVGTSSSLNELDLELMTKFTMIGTNDALGRFVTMGLLVPAYLLTAEVGATIRALADLKAHPEVTLITRKRVAEYAIDHDFEGDIYLYELKTKPIIPSTHGPFFQANNTAHYAVQAAARLRGFKIPGRIVLAGVDLRYPTAEELAEGKQNHYWGDGLVDGCRPAFDSAIQYFPILKKWLGVRGIQLVTASPWDGPLAEHLQRIKLEDLVQ